RRARTLEGMSEVACTHQPIPVLIDHRSSNSTGIGRGLDYREVTASARDLDVDHPEAYAYTSEKVFYLRSNLVENFPQAAFDMIRSRLENAPDVTAEFMAENKATMDAVAAKPTGMAKTPFSTMPGDTAPNT